MKPSPTNPSERIEDQQLRIEFRDGSLVSVGSASNAPEVLEPTDDPLQYVVDHEFWRFMLAPDGETVDGLNVHGYPMRRT